MMHQKLENVEYFNYSGSMITNDARCIRKIKSRIVMAKAAFSRMKNLFTSKLDLNLRKKLVKCYICSLAFMVLKLGHFRNYARNTWKRFKIWCLRRNSVGPIAWEIMKTNRIDHKSRRNVFLKHIIEGKIEREIEVKVRQGTRCKQLLDDLQETRDYCKLKEEALGPTLWRSLRLWACRRTEYGMNEWMNEWRLCR